MKNAYKTMSISEALKIWRKKHPSLSRLTVLNWLKAGIVKSRPEQHGFNVWHRFTEDEVDRVLKSLREDWRQGKTALPRPQK